MSFPGDTDCLMRASIAHRERTGAIHDFAKILHPLKANILSSYSRLQRSGERAQWKVTLDVTNTARCGKLLQDVEQSGKFFIEVDDLELSWIPSQRESAPLPNSDFRYTDEGIPDTMFKGRVDIINSLAGSHVLEAGKGEDNFLISGYYKTGKSCLLRHLQRLLGSSRGILPVYINLQGTDTENFWWSILRQIYETIFKEREGEGLLSKISDFFYHEKTDPALEKLGITLNLGFLKFEADVPSRVEEHKAVVRQAFRRALSVAQKYGFQGIVLLLDEAQEVLHDPSLEQTLHANWSVLITELPEVRWIVATSKDWLYPTDPNSVLLPKMRTIRLGPLDEVPAAELVSEPFTSLGFYVHQKAVRKILHLTGRQPCYVQAMCRGVYEALCLAPSVGDVVSVALVDDARPIVLKELSRHFLYMYRALLKIFDADAFYRLLVGEEQWIPKSRLIDHEMSAENAASFSLDVVPGLRVKSSFDNVSKKTPETVVGLNPLFRHWVKETASVDRSRWDASRQPKEAEESRNEFSPDG